MRVNAIKAILLGLNTGSDDIEASALISRDGLVIASVLSPGMDEDRVSAIVGSMQSLGDYIASELFGGGLEQVMIKGSQGCALIIHAGENEVLCTIATRSARLGLLFVEASRAAEAVMSLEIPAAHPPDEAQNLDAFCEVSGFSREDQAIMRKIQGYIIPLLPALTERFYDVIQNEPQMAPYLEGRVERLKKTHMGWLEDLFAGDYGPDFVRRQEEIAKAHVRVQVPPIFVAASMAFLRRAFPPLLAANIPDRGDAAAATAAVLRLLDLCQSLLDHKYSQVLIRFDQLQK